MSEAVKSFARRPQEQAAPEVIVASAHMRELLQFAERAAESDAKVLITGESGTGKDVLARYVHSTPTGATASAWP
jgi:DNA-binding NtrC family response regulator